MDKIAFFNQKKIEKYITQGVIIIFFGMVIQFLAHTFIVYKLGLPDTGIWSIVWTWKEIIALLLGIGTLLMLLKGRNMFTYIVNNKNIKGPFVSIIISFLISFIISLFIHHQSIITFIMSAKFNYFPLIIGGVGLLIGEYINQENKEKILTISILIIKGVLIFGLARYIILHTFSNGLDRMGYAQPGSSIEWTANTPPPSLRLTEFYTGYVRNQGPFGGPLSFGFWLSCLWPLFYAKVLFKKKISQTRGRWLLYIAMIFSTFSRAAWLVFFLNTVLMSFVVYRNHIKKIVYIGMVFIGFTTIYIIKGGENNIFIRTRSDSGHKEFISEGTQLVKNNWLWGLGAASVGPASYHIEGEKAFNPENQYMQIRLEYGILGLLGWFLSYCIFFRKSIDKYRNIFLGKKFITSNDIIDIFPGLSFIGLCIANIVLHPMTDSSSMYPYMIISGIVLIFNQKNDYKTKEEINLLGSKNIIQSSNIKQIKKYFRPVLYLMTIIRGFFFIIQTTIVYGINIVHNTVTVSLIRDSIFFLWISITLFLYHSYILSYINKYKIVLLSTLGLLSVMLYHPLSSLYEIDVINTLAGIKFDIQYIIILCCGLRLGHIISKEGEGKKLKNYIQWFIKFGLILLLGGIIWQLTKNVWPNFFTTIIGMSNPRDFIPFSKPPLFYLTGSGGIQRLNGLFVGPNTLGFFMIAFFSPLLYILRHNKYKIIITILYIIITIATLSRGAVIGIAFQSIIITLYGNHIGLKEYSNSMRKKIVIIGIISVTTLGVLLNINSRKSGSNSERVQSISQTIEIGGKKLFLGYGPGYVGPGKHYEANYLKNQKNPLSMIENIYLQIIINEGIIGFIFRSTIRIGILYIIYRREEEKSDIETLFLKRSLTFGLIGLLAVGLFLHVFIDSMVNYLFFIIYGIIISNTTKLDKE